MKILMVNKFLHPAGGAETYMFQLGACLEQRGHQVQYFGMEHPERKVSNRLEQYTSTMDFHSGKPLEQIAYPFKIIYSAEAKRKLTAVLEDFEPDIIHINNFNFQLTPSILVAAEEFRRKHSVHLSVVLTAHDYQLVCPNHMMYQPEHRIICEKCLDGHYYHCIAGKCIHGSAMRSVLGALESGYWHRRGIYRGIDAVICPSAFIKEKLDHDPALAGKTTVLHNFIAKQQPEQYEPKDYVLYFGRYSQEKGLMELLRVCRRLPEISFVFAGSGPLQEELEREMQQLPNVKNVGFQSGDALKKLIGEARFTVYPSVWYENCPFSVIESIAAGTPVLGTEMGGIPELLRDNHAGMLVPAGDPDAMQSAIETMWRDETLLEQLRQGCRRAHFDTLTEYYEKLMAIYQSTLPEGAGMYGAD